MSTTETAEKALNDLDQLAKTLIDLRNELVQVHRDNERLRANASQREAEVAERVLAAVGVLEPSAAVESGDPTKAVKLLGRVAVRTAEELRRLRERGEVLAAVTPWSQMLTELHLQAPEFAREVSRRLANRLGAHCPACWSARGWAHGDLPVISDRDMGEDRLR